MDTLFAYLNWQSWVSLPVPELPSLSTLGTTGLAIVLGVTLLEYLRLRPGNTP